MNLHTCDYEKNSGPYDEARQVYAMEPCARTFEVDVHLHLMHGYVFSGPDYFIMGRAVKKSAPPFMVIDPTIKFLNPDCWLVYLAAGKGAMKRFVEIMPYPLEWIGYQRQNILRFHKLERVIRLL